jgi:hypothetical protein
MFARMATANASARGQRVAILASPLGELTWFSLVVDCGRSGCGGERAYAVVELVASYSAGMTVSEALRRMRCGRECRGRAAVTWLATGPVLNRRIRPRRVALLGPEARE